MTFRPAAIAAVAVALLAGVARADVEGLLDKMHEAGRDMRTLSAKVTLTDYDDATGNEVSRPGRMALRRGEEAGDAAVHVVFNGKQTDAGFEPGEKIEYLLKNGELVDRNYRGKTQVVRKLPADELAKDPLALGEGPFPLPIGQDPARVKELFEVSEVDPAQSEWEVKPVDGATRLRLVPRPNTKFARDFTFIDVDVNPATGLPEKVSTVDAAEVNLRIADLSDVAVDADLGGESFELEDVDLGDWNVSFEDLSEPQPSN